MGLIGEAVLETVDRVEWKVDVSSSAILNGVRCFVTVGGAESIPISSKSRSMTSVMPEDVDCEVIAVFERAFSLSSTSSETNGEDRPSSQLTSLLLPSSYILLWTGVACLLAPICVFRGDFVGNPGAILFGVRLNGDGIIEPSAFAFEGERGDSGDSIVSKTAVPCW